MMRVFKRNDKERGAILEVWEKHDCLPCPCNNQGNCNQCDDGFLPPSNKRPLRWAKLIIKLLDESHSPIYYYYFAHGSYNLVYQSPDR